LIGEENQAGERGTKENIYEFMMSLPASLCIDLVVWQGFHRWQSPNEALYA